MAGQSVPDTPDRLSADKRTDNTPPIRGCLSGVCPERFAVVIETAGPRPTLALRKLLKLAWRAYRIKAVSVQRVETNETRRRKR